MSKFFPAALAPVLGALVLACTQALPLPQPDVGEPPPDVIAPVDGDAGVWCDLETPPVGPLTYRFDFQNEAGPQAKGHAIVTPADAYTSDTGFGFTTAPTDANDGSDHTWKVFGRVVSVDEAVPAAVLSDATRDCVLSETAFAFRADVVPGEYDVTVWIGDVTRPIHQVRVVVNDVIVDVARADINWRRGSFDSTLFGTAAPRVLRVSAPAGRIDVRVEAGPGSDSPVIWEYTLDECPSESGPKTAILIQPFERAALQAITIQAATPLPLTLAQGGLVASAEDTTPGLEAAVADFNAGQLAAARKGFEALAALQPVASAWGLVWVAGDPAQIGDEEEILDTAIAILEAELNTKLEPLDPRVERLLREARMAKGAERFRKLLGYDSSGAPAAENMGRSCSLTENFASGHPYFVKGQILWFRNRGGLDPRRCSVSFERAQALARSLEPHYGAVNPYVRLYATDEWENDGKPWTFIDWGDLAGEGPEWARSLVRALNITLDLSEWWLIHRQSPEGDIGGGWTDDVEIVGLFAFMAYVMEGSSDISAHGTLKLIDGIWSSGTINTKKGFQAAYADVEHSAEPTGNSLHLYPMVRYGDPEGIERMMKSARTFKDLFLNDGSQSPDGHRHLKGNHMSATQIANNPKHRVDIPLNGRIVAPLSWLLWYSSNPGFEAPLRDWVEAWIGKAARTDHGKPAGIFPNAVTVETDTIGFGKTGNWWGANSKFGQYNSMPNYHFYLYNLAALFAARTGEAHFFAPFDKIQEHGLAYIDAGSPALGGHPTPGEEHLWCGKTLGPAAAGATGELARMTGRTDWDAFLSHYTTSYGAYRQNPTDPTPILDKLNPVGQALVHSWPYRTTEGVMTDRLALPGMADVISYYLGADVYSVYYGLPSQAVTWKGTGRLFAAAVAKASSTALDATVYRFADETRTIGINFWGLEIGGTYVLEAGLATGLGAAPSQVTIKIPFTFTQRGDSVTFDLPGREVWAIRVKQTAPGHAVAKLRVDAALAPRDVTLSGSGDSVRVVVHNIGSAAAKHMTVELREGKGPDGTMIGSATLGSLGAPNDLIPRTSTLTFPYTPVSLPAIVTVVLDPEKKLDEITRVNNTITAVIGGASPDYPPPMLLGFDTQHPKAGATVTLTGKHLREGLEVLASEAATSEIEITYVNATSATIHVGELASGLYLLSVRNDDGKSSNLLPLIVGGAP